MKEEKIQTVCHGTPSVSALSACETRAFFAALLEDMIKIEEDQNNAVQSSKDLI